MRLPWHFHGFPEVSASGQRRANPGPRWGYDVIVFLEKYTPRLFFRFLLNVGILIGMAAMGQQRRASAHYWIALTGQRPAFGDQFLHFRAFMEGLILKLQAGRGVLPKFVAARSAHVPAFIDLVGSSRQVLFGTFHVGYSDMMGCMLRKFDRRISMVRLQVENSRDTEILEEVFGDRVQFLWINDPREFIFRLKATAESGRSIGLQCDRTEFGSKMEEFEFLGDTRVFPVTIYHLAFLFQCPVVFNFTGPIREDGHIEVYSSPVFEPGQDRRETLRRAHLHFQEVLHLLEDHLHRHPHLWFNFVPLPGRKGGVHG